jgi:hypothetical protein
MANMLGRKFIFGNSFAIAARKRFKGFKSGYFSADNEFLGRGILYCIKIYKHVSFRQQGFSQISPDPLAKVCKKRWQQSIPL